MLRVARVVAVLVAVLLAPCPAAGAHLAGVAAPFPSGRYPSVARTGTLPEFPFDMPTDVPSPRVVSRALFGRRVAPVDPDTNDLFTVLAQLVTIDLTHTIFRTDTEHGAPTPAAVERCDPGFDRFCTGNVTIPFFRALRGDNGLPETFTPVVLDASFLYGVSAELLDADSPFRDPQDRCKLRRHPDYPEFPPFDDGGTTFAMPESRVNSYPGVGAIVVVFFREHNARCTALSLEYPDMSDNERFSEARMWVTSVFQRIVTREYVPALLGGRLDAYAHDPDLDTSMDIFFSAVAFRYGHSKTTDVLKRIEADGSSPQGPVSLLDAYTRNDLLVGGAGLDPWIRGLLAGPSGAVDSVFARAVLDRPVLGFDQAAYNLNRQRDLGIPRYNAAREMFGLPRVETMLELAGGDWEAADILDSLYGGDVDAVEMYIGGLQETPVDGSAVGPLFHGIISEQLQRAVNADQLFYENTAVFDADYIAEVEQESLLSLVARHTGVVDLPDSPFDVVVWGAGDGDAASAPPAGTLQLRDAYNLRWVVRDRPDGDIIEVTLTVETTGWVGIGFGGSSMVDIDLVMGRVDGDGAVEVMDRWSDYFEPRADAQPDILPGSVSGFEEDGFTSITFSRLLDTGDTREDAVITLDGFFPTVFAWSNGDALEYHGYGRRGTAMINYADGSSITVDSDGSELRHVRILHGAIMLVSFGVLYPIGILIARYLSKTTTHWLFLHQNIMTLSAGNTLFASVANIVSGSSSTSLHEQIGFSLTAMLVLQIGLGYLIKYEIVEVRFVMLVRRSHVWTGRAMSILGFVNVVSGLELLYPNAPWAVELFYTWLAILVFIFAVFGELDAARRIRKRLRKDTVDHIEQSAKKDGDEERAVSSAVAMATGEARKREKWVPSVTMAEVEHQVASGQNEWMVVGDYVLDVAGWGSQHPGGSRWINDYLGKDATDKVKDHSRYARWKMNGMRVARIASSATAAPPGSGPVVNPIMSASLGMSQSFPGGVPSPSPSPYPSAAPSPAPGGSRRSELLSQPGPATPRTPVVEEHALHPHKVRWLAIREVTTLTTGGHVVILVRLALPTGAVYPLQPGQHVMVVARRPDGKIMQRPYSPVSGPGSDTIDLAVRIYPGGQMTQGFLASAKAGDMLQLMGPKGDPVLPSVSLVSKATPRWVVGVAGGTGLNPMIPIVRSVVGEPDIRVLLLIGNRSQDDLYFCDELDEWASRGGTTVVHSLTQPAEGWSGETGRIDESHILGHLANVPSEPGQAMVMVSGPDAMVKGVVEILREMGFQDDHLVEF